MHGPPRESSGLMTGRPDPQATGHLPSLSNGKPR
jgi:hypothetical protein